MQDVRAAKRHEIKHGRSAPQSRPRNLKQEDQIGMRLLAARNNWRGLGGFGHLAQYTAVHTRPGPSNGTGVVDRFGSFRFFAEQVGGGEDGGEVKRGARDRGGGSERRNRGATK